MSFPKPKHCEQNWLDMKPTTNGRLCGECQKNIVDFSKKSWKEIEAIQRANDYSVCGMYSNQQLKHWGQEPPEISLKKTAAAAALVAGLSVGNISAQEVVSPDSVTLTTSIKGQISCRGVNGDIDTLSFASVFLKKSKVGVVADENGFFELDLTAHLDSTDSATVVFSYLGYGSLEYTIGKGQQLEIQPQLQQKNVKYSTFYVKKPTPIQSITGKVKRWWRKED